MSELAFATAAELSQAYRRKKLSPVEATQAALARIDKVNRKLNAFNLVDAESALGAAKSSERRWAKGKALSPLDGVPTSIKDLVITKGWPTLRG